MYVSPFATTTSFKNQTYCKGAPGSVTGGKLLDASIVKSSPAHISSGVTVAIAVGFLFTFTTTVTKETVTHSFTKSVTARR